ncbi:ATP-binding protein [Sphingomonas sp. 8AM]|uniref:ATP-binding protein n=1 Tax=Sphingomonas sp. 8AM TaxID=2653170 RepID=UPI0012F472E5|nr:ATP-binding protein [Sphingomonas sp. 8AM]VXC33373.1 Histidine kinase [Sphingomonas sp. 8AM]
MSAAAPSVRPPRWRFILVGTLTPLVLAGLIGWTGIEHARSLAAQDEAASSFQRERSLLMLLSAVKDAETAQRGLLLTGDRAFLAPYAPARAQVERLLAEAGAGGRSLRPAIDAKFAELDETIALFDRGEADAVRREVASGRGKRIMDGLRDAVARAAVAERARSAERSTSFRLHRDDSHRLLEVIGALVSLILLAVMLALWRSQAARDAAAARHAAILASTTDTLVIVTTGGTIETINAAGHTLLGYDAAELKDRDLTTILPPRAGGADLRAQIGAGAARGVFPEQRARRRDGSEVSVDVAIGVMHGADGDRLVLSLRDASERLRAARAKDELISTVSHELRTPLTSVVGSLALLRAGTAGEWSPQAGRLVDIADNNARRLIRLVNDILDIDRIGSGQLTIARAPLDLRTITAQAALDGEGEARRRGVTLVDVAATAPVPVAGDAGRLLQVVTNLVSNAIHASPGGATVTLRTEQAAGRARVSVDDDGSGVPVNLRARLFDRFQSQRAAGGTGLGLAIAREIVRRLDGTIWFEDRIGGGTRFAFDLPLLAVAADAAEGAPLILHVDDDHELCEAMIVALEDVAATVCAVDPDEARAVLRAREPALVLLNLHVADGRGAALLPDLVDRNGQPVPLVLLSDVDAPPEATRRATAVLVKGRHDLAAVVATIRRLLRDREERR